MGILTTSTMPMLVRGRLLGRHNQAYSQLAINMIAACRSTTWEQFGRHSALSPYESFRFSLYNQ